MNTSLYTNYREAEATADELVASTGMTHLVIELFRDGDGTVLDINLDCLLSNEMLDAEHVFVVLSEAEWALVENEWDAEVQYDASPATG